MKPNYQTQILEIFANNPFDSYNSRQVASRVEAHDKASRQLVQATLQEMAEAKILLPDRDKRGKYKLNPKHINPDWKGRTVSSARRKSTEAPLFDGDPTGTVVGTLDMKQTGKAYLVLDSQSDHPAISELPADPFAEDILIAPNNTHHALHGDTVRVQLFPQRKMHKPEGQVVEIIKRARTRFVGILHRPDKRFAFMVCDSRNMVVDIFIPLSELADAEDSEKVLVEMTDWPEHMNNPVGRVIKRLGHPGDNNVEMQSILADYDFPLDFPSDALREAEQITPLTKITEAQSDLLEGRRDFRRTTTFTIDPADAKDFDDALSFRVMRNGHFEVGVHIADVSHYVQPGSAIDREAYLRGTSVYLVDRTIPMLPEQLCNGVCSLRPHEDKLCFSVVMEMNEQAEVLKTWFGKTLINSDARYDYEEAQEVIERGLAPDLKASTRRTNEAILQLHSLATILRQQRYDEGAINFESQEVKFHLDENGKPIGVYVKEEKEANWLIEEFMLLANRRVAERIAKGSRSQEGKARSPKTFVYRVHDEPNPEKLNTFVEFVAKLGYKLQVDNRQQLAHSYNNLFQSIAGRGEEYMIDTIAIRTMSRAYYSTHNIGHYGLGFRYYTHFTSPIRRYPDLMVHRLLEQYLQGGSSVGAEEYEEYCRHCSAMEKRASDAERASIKYKQAEYLSDKRGQTFPAIISGVSKWGLYAEIEGNKCEGMIPIGTLQGDYYMLDEDNYQVIGRRHGNAYKLGMPVTIRVKSVEMAKKYINFELVEETAEPNKTNRSNKANKSNKTHKSKKAHKTKKKQA